MKYEITVVQCMCVYPNKKLNTYKLDIQEHRI